MTIDDSESQRIAQIKAEHEANATKLYYSNPESESHARLQKKFNESGRRLHEAENRPGDYVEKIDVRHEYEKDAVSYRTTSEGTRREIHTSRMRQRNPDTVLKWRDTEIGSQQDKTVRRNDKNSNGMTNDGDDAGHHIGASDGVDPAISSNMSPQNAKQNGGGGTWYKAEREASTIARENSDKEIYKEVRVVYDVDKYGEKRPLYREMTVYEKDGLGKETGGDRSNAFDPKRDRVYSGGQKVAYANAPNLGNEKSKDAFGSNDQYKDAPGWDGYARRNKDTQGTLHSLADARQKREANQDAHSAKPESSRRDETDAVANQKQTADSKSSKTAQSERVSQNQSAQSKQKTQKPPETGSRESSQPATAKSQNSAAKQEQAEQTKKAPPRSSAFGGSESSHQKTQKDRKRVSSDQMKNYQAQMKKSDHKNKTVK